MLLVPYFRFLLPLRSTLQDLHMYLDGRDATRSDICDFDEMYGVSISLGYQKSLMVIMVT